VQESGQFYWAFVVAAVMAISGAGLYVFGVGPIKQVEFRARATPVTARS
jgi:hypothetical protein